MRRERPLWEAGCFFKALLRGLTTGSDGEGSLNVTDFFSGGFGTTTSKGEERATGGPSPPFKNVLNLLKLRNVGRFLPPSCLRLRQILVQ